MVSVETYNKEFIDIVREIMYLSTNINNPYDRVKVMQWLRRLRAIDESKLELSRIRNEYTHYLRILLLNSPVRLCVPFKNDPPPVDDELVPLPEELANQMIEKCPYLPRTGPIRPVLLHKTTDGKAFMTVKKIPEGGVFCYMAVAPEAFAK